jgi:hypothetical protein
MEDSQAVALPLSASCMACHAACTRPCRVKQGPFWRLESCSVDWSRCSSKTHGTVGFWGTRQTPRHSAETMLMTPTQTLPVAHQAVPEVNSSFFPSGADMAPQ